MMSFTLHSRVDSIISQFYKDQKFFNCKLISSASSYYSHTIVLSKQCKWFYEYFLSHPIKNSEIETVQLPCDPDGYFKQFLNLIYSMNENINTQNILKFLKLATFYKCNSVLKILEYIFKDYVNTSTILFLAKDFKELQIPEEVKLLSPFTSNVILEILSGEFNDFTLNDLFLVSDPYLIAATFKEPSFSTISDDEKLSLIDKYAEFHICSLNSSERESLFSIFNWPDIKNKSVITKIARHNCDWLPFSVYRSMSSEILTIRRQSLKSFSSEISKIQSNSISRWYPFSWLSEIRESVLATSSPTVSLVHMISTLGNEVNPLNPHTYNLINTFSSVEPVNVLYYDAQYILLDDQKYFVGFETGIEPGVGIDIGLYAKFVVESVEIDSLIQKNDSKIDFIRPYPITIAIAGAEKPDDAFKVNGPTIEMENGRFNGKIDMNGKGYSNFGILMKGSSSRGGNIFRIRKLELVGHFLPE